MKGLTINGVHSWNDLQLILSRAEIPPALPKTNFIAIPGADGDIDASEWSGYLRYNNRELQFVFSVKRMFDFWEKKRELEAVIKGQSCKIELEKDSGYYYTGRCWVSDVDSSSPVKTITVTMNAKPYKMDIVQYMLRKNLSGGSDQLVIENGDMPCIASITTTSDGVQIQSGNKTKTLGKGTTKLTDFILSAGKNTFTVKGSGTVTITMQRGWL